MQVISNGTTSRNTNTWYIISERKGIQTRNQVTEHATFYPDSSVEGENKLNNGDAT